MYIYNIYIYDIYIYDLHEVFNPFALNLEVLISRGKRTTAHPLSFHSRLALPLYTLIILIFALHLRYRFAKHTAVPKQILHFAYAHHEKIMTGHTQVRRVRRVRWVCRVLHGFIETTILSHFSHVRLKRIKKDQTGRSRLPWLAHFGLIPRCSVDSLVWLVFRTSVALESRGPRGKWMAQAVTPLTPLAPPTKGKMKGVTGLPWKNSFTIFVEDVEALE